MFLALFVFLVVVSLSQGIVEYVAEFLDFLPEPLDFTPGIFVMLLPFGIPLQMLDLLIDLGGTALVLFGLFLNLPDLLGSLGQFALNTFATIALGLLQRSLKSLDALCQRFVRAVQLFTHGHELSLVVMKMPELNVALVDFFVAPLALAVRLPLARLPLGVLHLLFKLLNRFPGCGHIALEILMRVGEFLQSPVQPLAGLALGLTNLSLGSFHLLLDLGAGPSDLLEPMLELLPLVVKFF